MKVGKLIISRTYQNTRSPLVHIFKVAVKGFLGTPGVTLKFTLFGHQLEVSIYREFKRYPKRVCPKGCPDVRDAGICLVKQGVPGAGGSFGDWCECDCHLECRYGCRANEKDHDVLACGCDCHYEGIGRSFRPV